MIEPELLLAHRDFVRALAAELVRDPSLVDDVEQQTMLAAWERRDRPAASPRAWLATVARNFARQFRRGDDRRRDRERGAAAAERIPSVAAVLEREERRRSVVAVVLALAEPYRAAVLLRFYEGLPPREIARRLELPVETARTRVKRGVELVRAGLLERQGSDRRSCAAWLLPLAAPIAKGLPPVTKWAALAAAGLVVGSLAWVGVRSSAKDARAHSAAAVAAASIDGEMAGKPVDGETAQPVEPARTRETTEPVAHELPWLRVVRGRVVDARRVAVAGATVFGWSDVVTEAVQLDDGDPRSRARATSDAEGRFTLRVPAELDRCTLFAQAAGFSPGVARFVRSRAAGDDDERDEAWIVLEDEDFLVGRVADLRGDAIAGARLRAWGMHGGALIEHETRTDEHGDYRLAYTSSDRSAWQGDSESWIWWVEACADGFAPRIVQRQRDLDPDTPAGEHRLDVVLLRGAIVRGDVLDAETRAPLPDARIVAVAWEGWDALGRNAGGSLSNPRGVRVVGEARSDGAGRFAIDHQPARPLADAPLVLGSDDLPKRMQLFAFAPGHAAAFRGLDLGVDGGASDVTLELWQSATITGRVIDAEGLPVAGVRVLSRESISIAERRAGRQQRIRPEPPTCVGADEPPLARTDTQGRYEIRGVPVHSGGTQRWVVSEEEWDWARQHEVDDELGGVEVLARAGAVATAPDLVVVPERSVIVEVVDEAGAPIAGALVRSEPRSFDSRRTDAAGRVRWTEPAFFERQADGSFLSRGAPRLRITRAGYVTTLTPPIEPSELEAPVVRVVLARGHELRGLVVDSAQRPAARAGVRVLRRAPTEEESAQLDAGKPLADATLLLSHGVTDEEGRFAIDDLPDGRWFVRVEPPVAWNRRRAARASQSADVAVDGPDVTLSLAAQ